MAEIKSGVLLKLKDEFSPGMNKAAGASGNFAQRTLGALDKVNSALSGTAAKLGAFGVTLSLGAAAKDMIALDAEITDLGVNAGMSAEEMAKLKRELYATANAPDIKLGADTIFGAIREVVTQTGDVEYATSVMRDLGLAIRATGSEAKEIGGLYSEFQKYKVGAKDAGKVIDTLTLQGEAGSIELKDLATLGPRVIAAYAASGRTGAGAIAEAGAALQVIRQGTGSSEQTATAFEAVMRELADPRKIEMIENFGVSVDWTKKSLLDLMKELTVAVGGSNVELNRIFGGEATRAFNYINAQYLDTGGFEIIEKFNGIVGDGSVIQQHASEKAKTLAANIRNVQTAFMSFAESNLTKPLANLTDFLNKLSEDPKRYEAIFNSIKRGLLIIGGVKITAGALSFLSTLRNFKGGSANINQQLSLTGSAGSAMPVFVTNWTGGAGGPSALLGQPSGQSPGAGGLLDQWGNPIAGKSPQAPTLTPEAQPKGKWNFNKPNWKGAGIAAGGAAAVTAVLAVPGMIGELNEISKNEEMTKEEKSVARGGVIGETAGAIGGAAAGALAGAAIGSVVPVVGTALGALAGGLIGQFGGPLGRFIGEKVGAATGKEVKDKMPDYSSLYQSDYGLVPAANVPPEITGYTPYEPGSQAMRFDGTVGLQTDLYIHDDGSFTATQRTKNNTAYPFETGEAAYARGMN